MDTQQPSGCGAPNREGHWGGHPTHKHCLRALAPPATQARGR